VLLRPQPCPVPLQVATARVELWAEGVKRGVRTTSAGITPPVAAPPSSVPPTSVPTSAGQGKRSDYAEPPLGSFVAGGPVHRLTAPNSPGAAVVNPGAWVRYVPTSGARGGRV
jgi:hypothetical protein